MNIYSWCLAMLIGSLTDFKSIFMVTIVVIGVTNPEIPVIKKRVWEVSSFFFSRTYNELEAKLMAIGNKVTEEESPLPMKTIIKPPPNPTRTKNS